MYIEHHKLLLSKSFCSLFAHTSHKQDVIKALKAEYREDTKHEICKGYLISLNIYKEDICMLCCKIITIAPTKYESNTHMGLTPRWVSRI